MDAGFNFPLRKGTEVILTHIDGDPDRPIIAGAVPNAETGNVGRHDESRNRIVSNSGNAFEIHDTVGATGFLMTDTSKSVVSDQRHRLGTQPDQGGTEPGAGSGGAALPKRPRSGRPRPKTRAEAAKLVEGGWSAADGLPGAGRGMAFGDEDGDGDDEQKVEGASGNFQEANEQTPEQAYEDFVAGDAMTDLKSRTYFDPNATGSDAPGSVHPFSGIGKSALDGMLAKVASKHAVLNSDEAGDPDYQAGDTGYWNGLATGLLSMWGGVKNVFSPAMDMSGTETATSGSSSAATKVLEQVNNFEGLAFGSRLRIWIGDTIQVNKGDKYTYADVTHDVSYGTGGYGFHEEAGHTNDESYQYGNASSRSYVEGNQHSNSEVIGHQTSVSKTTGNQISHSTTHGNSSSSSTTMGHVNDTSFFFGTKISVGFNLSAETNTELSLALVNSNSIFIGGKADLDICLALKGKIELELSGSLGLKVAGGGGVTWLTVGSNMDCSIPDKMEVRLTGIETSLQSTATALNETNSAIALNTTALKSTIGILKKDGAFLDVNNAMLKRNVAALSNSDAMLKKSSASLSSTRANATDTSLAANHTLA